MGGGPHVAPPPTGSGGIQQPMTLNLYPETSSADGSRLFIKVTAVGTASVDMPLAFDTGSAGPIVQQPSTAESVIGIGYFTTNSFFIDFTTGVEGWE